MDKYGVIKDVAERVKWGKFKRGCPISWNVSRMVVMPNKYMYLYKLDEKTKNYNYINIFFAPKIAPITYNPNNIMTCYNTEEELKNWGYLFPFLAYRYFIEEKDLKDYSDYNFGGTFNGIPKYILYITDKGTQPQTLSTEILTKDPVHIVEIKETDVKKFTAVQGHDGKDRINPAVFPFWDYEP